MRKMTPKLRVGDVYRIPGGSDLEYEVLRVSEMSALVKPLSAKHNVVRDKVTQQVVAEFDSPGALINVSPYSIVEIVRRKDAKV